MAKQLVQLGNTSRTEYVWIQDSSSTVGAGLTGLVFNSASLTADYCVERGGRVNIALVTQTPTGAWSSGGFCAVDNTNLPGLYRFDVPNAVFASADKSVVMLKGATNMAPVILEYQIVGFNPDDGVRLGLTALPNATAGASGGVPLSVNATGAVNTLQINGTAQTARDIGASVLLSSGTGTGQISLSSGAVSVSDKTGFSLATSQTFNTTGSVGSVTGSVTVGTNNDKTGYSLAVAPPTAAVIADAVWDEQYNTHTTPGSYGKLMDILRKANYVTEGQTTAGCTSTTINTDLTIYITDAFDNQTILFVSGTMMGTSGIINGNTSGGGVITLDEALPQAPASGVDFVILANHVHTKSGIADAVLKRNLDSSGDGTDTTDERTVRSALRAMRNKVAVSAGSMTVYKENDSTAAWTATLSNTADVTVDPTGGL